MTAEWRTYAKPNELAEHDELIAQDRANAARRKIIRNRCRMRGKQRNDPAPQQMGIVIRGGI